MNILDVLTSDAAIAVTITVAGGVWSLVKATGWFDWLRRRRLERALLALEAAVEQVYREYVRALKEAGEGLTPEEQQRAREYARERAIEIARAQGIDLLRELGADFLDLWIGRLVRKLKTA
ncbi:MAG TPA: hypothetical protein ENN29_03775 [Candidatus Hydrogenedentes bacterium]|nr:hypothetical protein [Candidatus Hydrogenedentota bacterium]